MTFTRLFRAWLIILPFMIANGILRELAIRRFAPDWMADAISAGFGMAIILVATRFLLHPLAGRSVRDLVHASATLVALTVTFEFLFGHYVDGKFWSDLAANYEVWNGKPWLVVLVTLAFTPFLWGRWSRAATRHAR